MKVFVTGASGWVGTHVCKELVEHGHSVVGLARSDASADKLGKAGYEVRRGDLGDVEGIVEGAKAADGVVHCAFIHDFSSMEAMGKAVETDKGVLAAIVDALAGTGKPLVFAAGLVDLSAGEDGKPADESVQHSPYSPRGVAEAHILALGVEKGVNVSAVRLSPTVHGVGDYGFSKLLIQAAQKAGNAGYIGDGHNTWPAVHVTDAAALFRLALEKGKAGSVYHAVQEKGVEIREIAEAIGGKLGVETRSLTKEEAGPQFGFLAWVLAMDSECSSEKTQKELEWQPVGPGLLSDLNNDGYYQ
ncbi:hypothetical protein MNV49_007381 [Pseudohyphozyma bogoriensis]|nr:hypothetical protein MNV49_007381 [Pseudohyphozyma bogoriensis]